MTTAIIYKNTNIKTHNLLLKKRFNKNCQYLYLNFFQGCLCMGKIYDGIHRISFLIDEQGNIEKVFDKFKTKDHHQVVLDYLKNS